MKLPILSLLLLFAFGIGILSLPQASFSETENRALSTWKAPTLSSLSDGSFSDQLRDFYADQFPLRTLFTAGKAYAERLLGKQENNGILFGKNGYLIPKNEYEDLSIAERNLAALTAFEERTALPLTTLLVPRSVDVMTSCLPSLYNDVHAAAALTLIERSDVEATIPLGELRNAAEEGTQVWYKTDHHWTSHGAYLAYVALADSMGYKPYPESFFHPQTVSENFLGTSYSTAGGVAEAADSIVLYRYEGDTRFEIQNQETGETLVGFYDTSALERKDQYQVFLGGNTGRVTVRNPDKANATPKLLLIKDSFANALVPFLALHFEIDLIDPRYYPKSVGELMATEAYDRILIEQGVDTLATDPSLVRLLH